MVKLSMGFPRSPLPAHFRSASQVLERFTYPSTRMHKPPNCQQSLCPNRQPQPSWTPGQKPSHRIGRDD